ncbi:hypothetical protein WBP06_06320 [Novosphingobium sp. BL-8H]|uniref:hypothetical protein n=1 Tax=Novosphingobium sp. BL-8H TaxID=3127640 RepID=UPI0037567B6D
MPSGRVETDNPESIGLRNAGALSRPAAMGVSLLFAPPSRPSVPDIEALLSVGEHSAPTARISYRPPDEEGWLELLASGLTFNISGLSPAIGAAPMAVQHVYGFAHQPELDGLEAIGLVPSDHIAGGGTMPPVVRTLVGLATALSLQLPVTAIAWHSAGTVMEPGYFTRIVTSWLSGGAFPALGLAALVSAADGSITSHGLEVFCGQEFQLEAGQNGASADSVKLALRVADHLVRRGPVKSPTSIEGTALLAEPSQVGKLVWIWRQD